MADEDTAESRRDAKRRLRREMFGWLRNRPDGDRAAASARIREHLAVRPEFREAGTVAAFLALPSEPDLDPLIRETLSDRQWCLPRVTREEDLEMRRLIGLGDLVTGKFKFREPDPNICPLVSPGDIDLILLPGVGFDPSNRARLGRGKGHYDRFLEDVRKLPSSPPVWGIFFSGQSISFEAEAHDQPLDAIVTEAGFDG